MYFSNIPLPGQWSRNGDSLHYGLMSGRWESGSAHV